MSYNKGMQFSTRDRDNDEWRNNCGVERRSGWWHRDCGYANLNGLYSNTKKTGNRQFNYVYKWSHGDTNMKTTTMMIRKM